MIYPWLTITIRLVDGYLPSVQVWFFVLLKCLVAWWEQQNWMRKWDRIVLCLQTTPGFPYLRNPFYLPTGAYLINFLLPMGSCLFKDLYIDCYAALLRCHWLLTCLFKDLIALSWNRFVYNLSTVYIPLNTQCSTKNILQCSNLEEHSFQYFPFYWHY